MQTITPKDKANTPAILTPTTGDTVIAANQSRVGWGIQNTGTNPIFLLMGAGATTSVFHKILKGGSADNDGLGASYEQLDGVVYRGAVSVAGTTPKCVITEFTD